MYITPLDRCQSVEMCAACAERPGPDRSQNLRFFWSGTGNETGPGHCNTTIFISTYLLPYVFHLHYMKLTSLKVLLKWLSTKQSATSLLDRKQSF